MVDQPKLTIETRWDVDTGIIDQRIFDSQKPLTDEIVTMVLRTKEHQIAHALQQLGWIPPWDARATEIADAHSEALRGASPGLLDSDEVPMARPVRAVVELPPGSCTEKELAGRLRDILRYPIKVLKGGNYARYQPAFKAYGRVVAAEKIREKRDG